MTPEEIQRAIDQLPRLPLNELPTPLHFCPRLSEELGGPRIFIKRDDLTCHAFGGNKSRYLELTVAHAVEDGSNAVVMSAVVQSNHCRQFSAATAKHGIKGVVVLRANDSRMGTHDPPNGNYLLHNLYGADVRIAAPERVGEVIDEEMDRLQRQGYKPARLSGERSNVAYIQCARELASQCQEMEVQLDHVCIGSGGTSLSGLVAGLEMLGHQPHYVGFPEGKLGTPAEASERVVQMARRAAAQIGLDCEPDAGRIGVDDHYVGAGFGYMNKQTREAIYLLGRTEAILVDPTYTGKAFTGLVDYIRQGRYKKGDDVIFVHTGGTPLLFVYGEELLEV
jgi:1-aminocyclopropane-1-carboxylate deaminase/D-cysteine desulfhydrase-like pyridoxal-dependent ACC family enzyme